MTEILLSNVVSVKKLLQTFNKKGRKEKNFFLYGKAGSVIVNRDSFYNEGFPDINQMSDFAKEKRRCLKSQMGKDLTYKMKTALSLPLQTSPKGEAKSPLQGI